MRIFCSQPISWPSLPEAPGPWYPATLCASAALAALYDDALRIMERAEELGFDGACVQENHSSLYNITPSPNMFAAVLARSTRNLRIAVLNTALPLYDPPVRVAEEYAMLDVLSGGRLIAGIGTGTGLDYFACGTNPVEANERFEEAAEFIVRAWTEPAPFAFMGKFTELRHVSIWPRPLQQPHPPIWVLGDGSLETLGMAARSGYGYVATPHFDLPTSQAELGVFRQALRSALEAAPGSERNAAATIPTSYSAPVFVAQSDNEAQRLAEPHVRRLAVFARALLLTPPGRYTQQSQLRLLQLLANFIQQTASWNEWIERGFVFAGSAETVYGQILEAERDLKFDNLLLNFQPGSMPLAQASENMERFAGEVMPRLRELGHAPIETLLVRPDHGRPQE